MKKVQITLVRTIIVIMILATLSFIWSNSAKNADISSGDSEQIVDIVKPVIDPGNRISRDDFTHFIRKAAHFGEFALLGFEICLLMLTFEKKSLTLPISVLGVILSAAADELIQLGSPGRAAAFTDVLIDTAGGLCGALFSMLLITVIKRITKKAATSKLDIVKK